MLERMRQVLDSSTMQCSLKSPTEVIGYSEPLLPPVLTLALPGMNHYRSTGMISFAFPWRIHPLSGSSLIMFGELTTREEALPALLAYVFSVAIGSPKGKGVGYALMKTTPTTFSWSAALGSGAALCCKSHFCVPS